jgi:hypothetical protein
MAGYPTVVRVFGCLGAYTLLMGDCGKYGCLVGVRRTLDGHLADTSVAFQAVEFLVGDACLMQRILRSTFRFPDLHVLGGLMLGEGNDLAHERTPSR